jgi:NAD(P)-dependent dehydrogenase (short-subunit alcohol dehydrogenase family)
LKRRRSSASRNGSRQQTAGDRILQGMGTGPLRAGVPLSRAEQAQDIANGVLFLASNASNYMTGAELVIDGGMTGGARPRWS